MDLETIRNFENEVASRFNNGLIRAPIHLTSNNENELMNIFMSIRPQDWVFCSWRSHIQCLLKGVDQDKLLISIMEGKSIALCFPENKIYSSAIVGGSAPWAVGVALSIKRRRGSERVFCFIGDMTSETGILQTCITYALNHELPLTFVVEDNNSSVMTDTRKIWNSDLLRYELQNFSNLIAYKYKSHWPHAGAGQRVQF